MAVIDADGVVLGRLCSHVAKRLLGGEDITVVNADLAVVSGSKVQLLKHYQARRSRGKIVHGPDYPRTPDMILKRSVRGMVKYQRPAGRAAYRRLRVYVGIPRELEGQDRETLESAKKPNLSRYVKLGEIAKALGSTRGAGR